MRTRDSLVLKLVLFIVKLLYLDPTSCPEEKHGQNLFLKPENKSGLIRDRNNAA